MVQQKHNPLIWFLRRTPHLKMGDLFVKSVRDVRSSLRVCQFVFGWSYIRQLSSCLRGIICDEILEILTMLKQMPAKPVRPLPTFSPLYRQIKDHMIQSLEAGEWGPGQMIPSEAELAIRFQVSQGTVRKAIDEMAAENFLVRRQGKGTFVATHDDPLSFYRFLRLMPDEGEAKQAKSEPVLCVIEQADADVATVLSLKQSAPVVRIKRLLSFDGRAVVLDDIILDADLFPGLDLAMLKASESSLYSFFETQFGVRMVRAEERLRAVAATGESANMLHVPEKSPLLLVERIAFTYGERPVEWRRGLYSTAQHHYLNLLG